MDVRDWHHLEPLDVPEDAMLLPPSLLSETSGYGDESRRRDRMGQASTGPRSSLSFFILAGDPNERWFGEPDSQTLLGNDRLGSGGVPGNYPLPPPKGQLPFNTAGKGKGKGNKGNGGSDEEMEEPELEVKPQTEKGVDHQWGTDLPRKRAPSSGSLFQGPGGLPRRALRMGQDCRGTSSCRPWADRGGICQWRPRRRKQSTTKINWAGLWRLQDSWRREA